MSNRPGARIAAWAALLLAPACGNQGGGGATPSGDASTTESDTGSDAAMAVDAVSEDASDSSASIPDAGRDAAGDAATDAAGDAGDAARDAIAAEGGPPVWACLSAYVPAASRDAATWPFASDSPWNTPLGAGAQFETAMGACTRELTATSSGYDVAAHQWSQPVWIAKSSDPTVTLTQQGQPFASGVHCPAGASPALPAAPGTDGNLNIVDPQHAFLDESWRAVMATGGWDAQFWFKQDLHGPGCTLGGVRAYGGSTIAGLIRIGELKTSIPHALGFALDTSLQKNAWVWPAISNDGAPASSYQGAIAMGQLAAIPPGVDLCTLGLTPGGLVVARALQDFGAYLVDSSTGVSFYAEPPIEDDAGLGEVSLLDGARNDLPAIMAVLRCVTNSSASTVGGGGARRAPPAPGL
jgi:hypothetical protein